MRTAGIILLFSLAVGAGLPPRAFGDNGDPVSITFQEKDGHFDLTGKFSVQADPDLIWATLNDFKNYPKYSPELKKVEVHEVEPNHLTVDEMAESGFLFFSQKVFFSMDVLEEPGHFITGTDVGHKSFVSYQYRWDIDPGGPGEPVELTYHVLAEGHFGAPAFMVNDGFKGGVKNFLENFRKEILERKAKKPAATPAVAATPSAGMAASPTPTSMP